MVPIFQISSSTVPLLTPVQPHSLKNPRHVPASGPLHYSGQGFSHSSFPTGSISSSRSQLKCHLLREALLDLPKQPHPFPMSSQAFHFLYKSPSECPCAFIYVYCLSPGSQLLQGRSLFVGSFPCLVSRPEPGTYQMPVNLCRRNSSVGLCLHVSIAMISYMKIPHRITGPPSKGSGADVNTDSLSRGTKSPSLAEGCGGSWEQGWVGPHPPASLLPLPQPIRNQEAAQVK